MGVYAFAGGKGGVGKTTTALNVGVALRYNGYDVIVVDADLGMTDLGRLMDIDADPGIHGVLAGDAAPMEAVVDGPEDIRLLPGQTDLDALQRSDPAKLPAVFDRLSQFAEFVLVDTSAGLSHDALVSFGAADGVVLLTTTKRTALGDTRRTAELVDQVDGTVLGTVVARAGPETDLERVVDVTDTAVISAVADDPAVSKQAVVAGDKTSDATKGYRHIAAILEAAEFADDPVSAARSVEVPKVDTGGETDDGDDQESEDADGDDQESEDADGDETDDGQDEVLGLFHGDEETR